MANSDHQRICDAISELAAALTKAGDCPELPGKLMAFTESPNLSCQAVGLKMVADLVEIAKNSPSSFTTYLADFVQALSAIAKTSEAKDGVRQMAVEVLLCIVEDRILYMHLNLKEFASKIFSTLLEFMLPAEDDGDEIKQDNSALDAVTSRNYDIGEKGLNRMASKMGENKFKYIFFYFFVTYFKEGGRQHKVVALMAIKQLFGHLDEDAKIATLRILNEEWTSQYSLVKFKALDQINYKPKFQQSYAKVFLPVLVNLFDDPSPTVQSRVVAVFINFAKGTEKADLMPFADQFMERLLDGIKPEKPMIMREQCIEGIGVVADVIEKEFIKYYSFVVPMVKKIIVASSSTEENTIRKNAMLCIIQIDTSVEVES